MDELDKITGKMISMIYHNESNYFSVARFELYQLDEKEIIITGYFKEFAQDQLYHLEGRYVEHPRYGMQFKVESYKQALPTETDSLIRFFSGPLFPGVGKKFAETLIETLGEEVIDKIKDDPDCLNFVPKMNEKRKSALIEGLRASENELEKTVSFLQSHGLGIRNIMRIDRVYGQDALAKINENPYRMVQEVDGIGFITADKLAMSLGFEKEAPARIEAALVALVMEMSMANGDSYVEIEELPDALKRRCEVNELDFAEALFQCLIRRELHQEENRIYHMSQYLAEQRIAQYCTSFPLVKMDPYQDNELRQRLELLQDEIQIRYDQKQIEAIESFFSEDLLICTGGPGTGKTTVVKAMVTLFRQLYPYSQIACCAPTGRAAKRLAELTGVECSTIHSLLRWDLETNTFGKNETEPLTLDCLIIDEFSMVDAFLFSNLVMAGAQIKKICIIGDEDQLPSVSCGCVLKDLIDSNLFPCIRLQTIFRQKEGSDVIALAHQIRHNDIAKMEYKGDVAFFECDQYGVKDSILKIVQSALDKGYSIQDVQVLACKYNGVAGIDRLNAALQECLNPISKEKREWKVGYRLFREQDKILQLKNQIDDDVFNGDIGTLIEIIYPKEDINNQVRFIVDFEGILVEYTQENFHNITHAYCVSVHKAQGSEYPIVIMPIVKEAAFMLKKRLLYTGITRAKKSLILIGNRQLWEKGILNTEERLRKTTLQQIMKQEMNH